MKTLLKCLLISVLINSTICKSISTNQTDEEEVDKVWKSKRDPTLPKLNEYKAANDLNIDKRFNKIKRRIQNTSYAELESLVKYIEELVIPKIIKKLKRAQKQVKYLKQKLSLDIKSYKEKNPVYEYIDKAVKPKNPMNENQKNNQSFKNILLPDENSEILSNAEEAFEGDNDGSKTGINSENSDEPDLDWNSEILPSLPQIKEYKPAKDINNEDIFNRIEKQIQKSNEDNLEEEMDNIEKIEMSKMENRAKNNIEIKQKSSLDKKAFNEKAPIHEYNEMTVKYKTGITINPNEDRLKVNSFVLNSNERSSVEIESETGQIHIAKLAEEVDETNYDSVKSQTVEGISETYITTESGIHGISKTAGEINDESLDVWSSENKMSSFNTQLVTETQTSSDSKTIASTDRNDISDKNIILNDAEEVEETESEISVEPISTPADENNREIKTNAEEVDDESSEITQTNEKSKQTLNNEINVNSDIDISITPSMSYGDEVKNNADEVIDSELNESKISDNSLVSESNKMNSLSDTEITTLSESSDDSDNEKLEIKKSADEIIVSNNEQTDQALEEVSTVLTDNEVEVKNSAEEVFEGIDDSSNISNASEEKTGESDENQVKNEAEEVSESEDNSKTE